MLKRIDIWIIFIILLLGLFFRLYNFDNFLYWSDDEQQQWYMLTHIIVDRHPSLVMPNAALGVGLNPIYHYALVPLYLLAKFNPITLQASGLLFYFLNLPLLYIVGKYLGGRMAGAVASFMYALSFVSSLFDKRLWALSPNFFVVLLTILALAKIVEKKYKYAFLLLPALVLPFSSDPSLGIVLLPIAVAIILTRTVLPRKILVSIFALMALSLFPLAAFEIRHNFQNTRSLVTTITTYQNQAIRADVAGNNFLQSQIKNFSRFFFLGETSAAESVFCYCFLDDKISIPLFLFIVVVIVYFSYQSIWKKDKNSRLLLLFLLSYLIGKYLFQTFFKGYPAFFYSVAISPVLFLMAGKLFSKFPKIITAVLLFIFLSVNINSLSNSHFKYPLADRLSLARQINAKDYSLYYSGDILVSGGGYTALFDYQGNRPNSGSLSLFWGHLYQSYGLYEFGKTASDTIVIISEKDIRSNYPYLPSQILKQGNLYAFVYDNHKKWFVPAAHLEKLYQPKYF